jgi:uncharacterized protein YjiS (DUF1127 family)
MKWLKDVLKGVAEQLRKNVQSAFIRRELANLGDHLLEDIGMDEEMQKRKRESAHRYKL